MAYFYSTHNFGIGEHFGFDVIRSKVSQTELQTSRKSDTVLTQYAIYLPYEVRSFEILQCQLCEAKFDPWCTWIWFILLGKEFERDKFNVCINTQTKTFWGLKSCIVVVNITLHIIQVLKIVSLNCMQYHKILNNHPIGRWLLFSDFINCSFNSS